ncbi:MAG: cyclic nucleotide-binding domain-containing protein [Lewinella sp.]|nr:cyclic nucleotide-binding domain-containing protein [Lewinella sp.]
MTIIQKPTQLAAELQALPIFSEIELPALEWPANFGELCEYEARDHIFRPDEPAEYMQIVLSGAFQVRFPQKEGLRELGIYRTGYITGLLPFSRMKEAKAYGTALEPTRILAVHRDHFTEMVNVSYELVQTLVGAMSTRIREFSQLRSQNEKLMSLGKLSAGLAHELNNPASAIVRSVEELYHKVHQTPEKFKAVITMRVTPEQTDAVNAILFDRLAQYGEYEDLGMLEQEARKDDLLDWLEDHDIADAEELSETFVGFCVKPADLERINTIIQGESLATMLWWVESTLSLERLVREVRESADRIADIVQSVKAYTHMDQGAAAEAVDVHEGLKNTLIILKHKLKKKQIKLEKDKTEGLPRVRAFPGELNQVWTNLIDNAIDAMSPGGTLRLRTYAEYGRVYVEITDDGHGIPEEIKSRIFDPFFTTKGVGEGTGLGLEVTRRIVEKHEGSMKVTSRPGETTFCVALPVA